MMARRLLAMMVFLLVLPVTGSVASAAGADGLPVGGVDAGPGGIADPDRGLRYVTLGAGSRTVVARVATDGGQVYGHRFLRQSLTIPAVALDGSTSGLSRDGETLVLIRPRQTFPQSQTKLVILDPRRFAVRQRLTLRGDFSFDAISPDGSLVYFIQYQDRRDPRSYAVRAYDLDKGRMLPDPIIDPREPDEAMRGFPVTRATSPDGRWAYTLYDGAGSHPFIHALDTVERTAACIDLDALAGNEKISAMRLALSADAGHLAVTDRGRAVAVVDTRTFRVSEPAVGGKADEDGVGALELVGFGVAAVLLGAGVLTLAFRRRRLATT